MFLSSKGERKKNACVQQRGKRGWYRRTKLENFSLCCSISSSITLPLLRTFWGQKRLLWPKCLEEVRISIVSHLRNQDHILAMELTVSWTRQQPVSPGVQVSGQVEWSLQHRAVLCILLGLWAENGAWSGRQKSEDPKSSCTRPATSSLTVRSGQEKP